MADLESEEAIRAAAGKPVGPPLGELREWQGADDAVWLYFAAQQVVPTPHEVTGQPPKVEPVTSVYPPGAVF